MKKLSLHLPAVRLNGHRCKPPLATMPPRAELEAVVIAKVLAWREAYDGEGPELQDAEDLLARAVDELAWLNELEGEQ